MGVFRVLLPLLPVLLLSLVSPVAVSGYAGKSGAVHKRLHHKDAAAPDQKGLFILGRPRRVVKTEAGEVRVVSGRRWRGDPSPMHIGFVSMHPQSLLIPQYIDANLILFVHRGEARVGWIHNDRLEERNLTAGDVNVITAGSAFYVANTHESENLHIICSVDGTENAGFGDPFFIGGGNYPTSVLSGFENITIRDALNITSEQLDLISGRQSNGPIIYVNHTHSHDQSQGGTTRAERKDVNVDAWSLTTLLNDLKKRSNPDRETKRDSPNHSHHVYNIYDKTPSYQNDYGWSIAVNEHDFSPLSNPDVSLYLVNLTQGSMLAPHLNPRATEYGIVLNGAGTIEVVFPNGTTAMNAQVRRGDVFWIPRYFPFCQVASSKSPLEFFGFTTSSSRNRPQFLAGASSVLRSMRGPELAAAFGISEDQLEELVQSQQEHVILPHSDHHQHRAAPAKEEEKKKERRTVKGEEEVYAMMRWFFA